MISPDQGMFTTEARSTRRKTQRLEQEEMEITEKSSIETFVCSLCCLLFKTDRFLLRVLCELCGEIKNSNGVLLKKMRVVFDLQTGAVGLGAHIEDSYDADPGAEVVCVEQHSAAGVFRGIGIVAGEENIG